MLPLTSSATPAMRTRSPHLRWLERRQNADGGFPLVPPKPLDRELAEESRRRGQGDGLVPEHGVLEREPRRAERGGEVVEVRVAEGRREPVPQRET